MTLSTYWRDVNWYKATTLSERVLLGEPEPNSVFCVDREPVGKRSDRWRSQSPFASESLFAQRLQALGIDNERFTGALDRSAASIRLGHSKLPFWLTQLSESFSDSASQPLPIAADGCVSGLLTLARPLVTGGLSQFNQALRAILKRHSHATFRLETLEDIFVRSLAPQLFSVLCKVAVLELNVARVQGTLQGKTQQDRYRNFIERIQQPEAALAIMLEYPVLARQLVIRVHQWISRLLEFVDRLCSDWQLLCRTFSAEKIEPGDLVNLTLEGDRHRGGRCVLIATFSSGFKLVYKPKSLAVDEHFQQFLDWVNERGTHPELRTLKILNCGSYGWSEFVAPSTCSSVEELRRFYQRQGAYLALLYVLEATDFHNENLIAAGEHPVLVDLEALFHPRLEASEESNDADMLALTHSVLRVGLLPWHRFSSEDGEGIDISGLGGAAGQLTPYTVPYWEKAGTDEMNLSRRQMPLQVAGNLPSFNDRPVVSAEYSEEIKAGFTSVYHLLSKHRAELLAQDGPLHRFANDEVRAIFRPTRTYGVLLEESFHPDVMRDALDRDALFGRLWIAVERWPQLARVISAECEDLHQGDIPYFSTRPSSLHTWTSGNTCIPNMFASTPLSQSAHRLRNLDEKDLALQQWLIRASFAATLRGNTKPQSARADREAPQEITSQLSLLEASKHIADKLERAAIRWGDNASWVGLTVANERQWIISPTMLDLYDGLPGIALFLGYLGEVTHEERYSNLSRAACNTMIRRIEEFKRAEVCIGAFSGWGGIVYTLSHLGYLLQNANLTDQAHELVGFLSSRIAADNNFDIIAGAAGCIGGLLALYSLHPSADILRAVSACGDHLVAHAQPMTAGVGWITPKQSVALSGFAHGAAGITWALLRVYALTGRESFRKAAEASFTYERSLFDCQSMNWRDLRELENSKAVSPLCAWCHGAAGIGLSRVSALSHMATDEVYEDIDIALNTTIKQGFAQNHSLCHGALGNLELLLHAGRVLNDDSCNVRARQIASEIAASVLRDKGRCATPLELESPGLMTGLSGIGFELLRIAHPEQVPSILTLQPPIHRGGVQ